MPLDARPPALTNTEAEQSVLGCVLYDNSAWERIEGLDPHHFAIGFHAELWRILSDMIGKGLLAEPVLLTDKLAAHPAFEELGGIRYLADMVDHAPPAVNAADYARVIIELAISRELARIGGEITEEAASPELSAAEKIEGAEQRLFTLAETGSSETGLKAFGHYLAGAIELAAEAYERDGKLSGLSTGLNDLDRKLGGLHPSDLLILAARPSMGKSSLAVNIAFNVARRYAYEAQKDGARKTVAGGVVAFFSLETSGDQVGLRIIADVGEVPSDRIRRGDIGPLEFMRVRDAATELQEAPLYIDDTGAITLAKLRARARRLKRTVGLDLIVVDYLQLMGTGSRRGEGRVQEVTEITGGLKALAKELHVPVVACAQLSRQVESRDDKRPQLADLRESGSIEQDADVVMFIYREAYYLGRAEPKAGDPKHHDWVTQMEVCRHQADIIIAKQRHGPIGTVKLRFDENLTRFSDPAREERYGGN